MLKTSVGYTGGSTSNPTYKTVKGGDGHTEAIRIEYDPSKVTYDELLDMFYKDSSAESTGCKVQYKSAIWVHSQEQRAAAEERARLEGKNGRLDILDAQPWTDAEEYHQKYYSKKKRAAPGLAIKKVGTRSTKGPSSVNRVPAKKVPTESETRSSVSRAMSWLASASWVSPKKESKTKADSRL